MKPKIVTIGAHGFTADQLFGKLVEAKVDVFCDIRERRSMRGSQYAFANSGRLQARLGQLGIRYVHLKALAPTKELRRQQHQEDLQTRTRKRSRTHLTQRFIDAYEKARMKDFDAHAVISSLGDDARVIAFFCVEQEPNGCHRSIVARRICDQMNLKLEHITRA